MCLCVLFCFSCLCLCAEALPMRLSARMVKNSTWKPPASSGKPPAFVPRLLVASNPPTHHRCVLQLFFLISYPDRGWVGIVFCIEKMQRFWRIPTPPKRVWVGIVFFYRKNAMILPKNVSLLPPFFCLNRFEVEGPSSKFRSYIKFTHSNFISRWSQMLQGCSWLWVRHRHGGMGSLWEKTACHREAVGATTSLALQENCC